MKNILLGIGLEISAFAILLLSELWNLPLTFCLFVHLIGVYFFTKGFDPALLRIHLRRELCFIFSFIFPLAGMAGILFYILVLKKVEERIVLPLPGAPARPAHPVVSHDEAAFLEDDSASDLATAFVRKTGRDFHQHKTGHASDFFSSAYYSEGEYSELEQSWALRIQTLAEEAGESLAGEKQSALADALIEYVSLFHVEPLLREKYLDRAFHIYGDLSASSPSDREILEKLSEIAMLKGNSRECIQYCEKLRRGDKTNPAAFLRMGECYFKLKEFKKLALLAREIMSSSAVPEALKELAVMWYRYG